MPIYSCIATNAHMLMYCCHCPLIHISSWMPIFLPTYFHECPSVVYAFVHLLLSLNVYCHHCPFWYLYITTNCRFVFPLFVALALSQLLVCYKPVASLLPTYLCVACIFPHFPIYVLMNWVSSESNCSTRSGVSEFFTQRASQKNWKIKMKKKNWKIKNDN